MAKSFVTEILTDRTTTGAGDAFSPVDGKRAFQVTGSTTASTGAAEVAIEVSNDGDNWVLMATVTLTLGTSETSDGFTSDAPWKYVRARVVSISGTGASVSVFKGNRP